MDDLPGNSREPCCAAGGEREHSSHRNSLVRRAPINQREIIAYGGSGGKIARKRSVCVYT